MGGGFDPLVVPTLIDRQKRKVVVDSKVFRREQKTKSSPCFFWGGPFFFQKRKWLVSSKHCGVQGIFNIR